MSSQLPNLPVDCAIELFKPGLRKTCFFAFLKKKQDFVLFQRKTRKKHSELFVLLHAISLFSQLAIMTCYTYYDIQN